MFFRRRFSLKNSLPDDLYFGLAKSLTVNEFETLENLLVKYDVDKQEFFKRGGFDALPLDSSSHAEILTNFINSMASKLCQYERFDDANILLELSFKFYPELNFGHATMALLKTHIGPLEDSKKHAQQFLFDSGYLKDDYGKLIANPFMTQEEHHNLKFLMAQIILTQELRERLNENQRDYLMVESLLKMTNGPDIFPFFSLDLVSDSRNENQLNLSLVTTIEHVVSQGIVVAVYSMVTGQGLTESILDIRTKDENFLLPSNDEKKDKGNAIALRLMEIVSTLTNENKTLIDSFVEKAYEIGREYE